MAQVKLEVEYLWEQNATLTQQLAWCDSVQKTKEYIIVQMDDLLSLKEEQISNQAKQITLWESKFDLSDEQIRKERRLKWIFAGTTVLMAGFLTLSLL